MVMAMSVLALVRSLGRMNEDEIYRAYVGHSANEPKSPQRLRAGIKFAADRGWIRANGKRVMDKGGMGRAWEAVR